MWIKQENELSFTASEIEALQGIPNGNWLLKHHPMKGFYLEEAPAFKFPKKIYGDSEKIAKRYLNTFNSQSTNLGILLTGLKGTGKSVTAKLTCAMSNIPVILITEPFEGHGFKSFLSNIFQEVIVFIDEFEKVYYDTNLQNGFLSILDGIFEGKKMFLFTSNEKGKINQYMINRPGRVHYLKEYEALDMSIINDVIDDNLKIKENKDGLLEVINILSDVTMDMIISLIKEMNLYSESARESIRFLNLKPEKVSYGVTAFRNNLRIGGNYIEQHPLTTETVNLELYCSDLTIYEDGATNHDEIVAQVDHWKHVNVVSLEEVSEVRETTMSESECSDECCDNKEISPVSEHSLSPVKTAYKTQQKRKSNSYGGYDAPTGYVRFTLTLADCKVQFKEKQVIITDEYGNRFEFDKRTYYSFGW